MGSDFGLEVGGGGLGSLDSGGGGEGEPSDSGGGDEFVALIDAEIMALREEQAQAQSSIADSNQPVPEELLRAAQRVFPTRMQDPGSEGQKVQELTAFAASEGRAADPAALLNFFHALERLGMR